MRNLLSLIVSLLCLTLVSSCQHNPYEDLNTPVGYECINLNKDYDLEEVRGFLLEHVSTSPDNFPFDDLYGLVGSLNGEPACSCTHSGTGETIEVPCKGFKSADLDRYDEIESWMTGVIKELTKCRKKRRCKK